MAGPLKNRAFGKTRFFSFKHSFVLLQSYFQLMTHVTQVNSTTPYPSLARRGVGRTNTSP